MPFAPGQGSRHAGSLNRSSRELRIILDRLAHSGPKKTDLHAARLHALTQSEDEAVAVKALTTVLAYRFGQPVKSIEMSGPEGTPVAVRFIISDQP